MPDLLIQTDRLTKVYGAVKALAGCDLAVRRGEVFGLLGPNGSGKTTLLRLLMGFLRPTGGGATIDGLDCYRQCVQVHGRVSYLPGEPRLFRRMRGGDVLKFFSAVRPDGDFGRAVVIAERLDLDLSRQVATSSTGMRQKLALSAVMAADAPLYILDEPTSSLDPTARREVLKLVREARERGRTIVFSSHVLSEVEEVCDRVAVLRKGELVHVQPMAEVKRRHRIRATLNGTVSSDTLPRLPEHLSGVSVRNGQEGKIEIETPGELAPLLGWLAALPLAEVHIEPLGLKAVYDQFHGEDQESGIRSQESGIRSQESGVRDQESGIRSQKASL
jgi:ABC-2 type transport system ATP-binding protein